MRKQYKEALYFVTYPHKMTHYFLNRGVEILRLGIFSLISMLSFTYGHFKTTPGIWSTIGWLVAIASNVFLILVMSQAVNRLLTMLRATYFVVTSFENSC